mmetsp:Transcript_9016/g.6791  ORF Transcript_9016/g.6791 Transcript_9016/m.6791 type:complete len:108 (+) Transcript_9016:677-1000(+)
MKIIQNLEKIYNSGEIMINKLAIEKLQIYLSTDRIKELLKQDQEYIDEKEIKRRNRVQQRKDQKTGWQSENLFDDVMRQGSEKPDHLLGKYRNQFMLSINMAELGEI